MQFEPLNRNNDFVRAYKRGKCLGHAHVVIYAFAKKRGPVRVGITASKKIGGAVVRNRARRVIRHAIIEAGLPQTGHYDLVFVARGQTAALKSTQLAVTIRKQLGRLEAPRLAGAQNKPAAPQNGKATAANSPTTSGAFGGKAQP